MTTSSRTLLTALLAAASAAAACFDARALPELDYGVDVDKVWADGGRKPVPAEVGERRILVTNNLDDTVSVVSWQKLLEGGAGAELSRFPVGLVPLEREGPHHLSVDRAGRFAFVGISNFVPGGGSGPHGIHGGGTADGRALLIDLDSQRTIKATRVDKNPGDIRLTPDGRTLIVSHFDLLKINEAAVRDVFVGADVDARLGLIDAVTLERGPFISLCPAPHGIAITSDSRTLVSSCLSDEAAVVDLAAVAAGVVPAADNDVVVRIALVDVPGTAAQPTCSPYATTLSADDTVAWISCYASGEIVAVDVERRTRGITLALPGLAVFGDYADSGDRFAIATQDTDGIVVLDDTGEGTASVRAFFSFSADVCALPHTAHFFDDDTRIAVVCEGNKIDPGALVVVAADDGSVVGRVELGRFPDDIAVQERQP